MIGFSFETTRAILCRAGAARDLAPLVTRLGAARVLVVTDRGIVSNGLLDAPRAALDAAGLAVAVYDGVVADPPEAVVLAAIEAARAHRADCVVGFGGGSPMDVAKLAALCARTPQPLTEAYGVGNARGARLPLIQVPTTAGTGSEVTPIAIVTTGTAEKKGVVAPQLLPDWAVLDAELTLGLPAPVTAATGIDAMVHAIEAYTSRHRKNPLSDLFAREALGLIAGAIRTACRDGRDIEARERMLRGAMYAGMAFANAPVAAVHALAYPIGGHFHVPHGLSNALVLTPVLRFNLPAASDLYAELAPIVRPGATRGEDLVDALEALAIDLAVPRRLGDVGISHNHLPLLAEDAMKQTRLLVNNPRDVSYADALALYQAVL